jgi:cysteine desulfurase family protein (TIGR01976 family)
VPPFDVAAARARFSSLHDGFAYLDAPGGTQTPDEVAAAVTRVYREASGNGGAPYATSRRIDLLVAEARADSARFLGCDPEEIVFGGSMTSLNFSLSRALGRALQPGDEVLVTRLDHDANVAPWLDLARDEDLVVQHVDVNADTTLDVSDLRRRLGPRTRVVAFTWASNAVGTTVDARAVCDLAHQAGALAWIDAVQYAPHAPIDVRAVGADVLLCSAYKFCGPHLGIAYGRREVLESWHPYKARPAPMQPAGRRFETGTLPYELLGGLIATFGYLDSLGGVAAIGAWERELGERLLAGLPPGARLYGLPTMSGRVASFLVNFPGVSSAALSASLAELGFGVWSGEGYYSPGLHERIAWGEALRIGLAHYNTLDEVDRFNQALASLVEGRVAGSPAPQPAAPPRRPGTVPPGTVPPVPPGMVPTGTVPPVPPGTVPPGPVPPVPPGTGLNRRLVRVPPGAWLEGAAGSGGELWFVIEGDGLLDAGEELRGAPLAHDTGLWTPPGARYRLQAGPRDDVLLDAVTLPPPASPPASAGAPRMSYLHDCDVEVTGDRRFRVLLGPGRGCEAATQFRGEIPPGRAPEHSHPYDEVVRVLEGEGLAHAHGTDLPLAPGSCIHLPRGLPHCLENTGSTMLVVLGVFHPGGSPASKVAAAPG